MVILKFQRIPKSFKPISWQQTPEADAAASV